MDGGLALSLIPIMARICRMAKPAGESGLYGIWPDDYYCSAPNTITRMRAVTRKESAKERGFTHER
jgi:hypothetical protein